MKKILFAAALGVAGVVSANSAVTSDVKKITEEKTKEANEKKTQEVKLLSTCFNYGILIPCTDEVLSDTICYGEDTDVPTYEDARLCMRKNSLLAQEFFCNQG